MNAAARVEFIEEATGRVAAYSLHLPFPPVSIDKIAIEKRGDALCLYHNGRQYSKAVLKESAYTRWEGDGIDLLGDYYTGRGEGLHIQNLYILINSTKYGCE